MSIKTSTGLRNALMTSGSFKQLMDGGEIRIFAGTIPVNADADTAGAPLLCVIRNGANGITFDSTPVDGMLQKNLSETWGGTCVGTGNPTFYRHVLSSDDNAHSLTALRYQGTVGFAGKDMNLTAATLTQGAPQSLEYHAFAFPEG